MRLYFTSISKIEVVTFEQYIIFDKKGIKMSLENVVKLNTEFETNFTKLSFYKSIIFISFAILIKIVTCKILIDCSKTSMHYRGYILPNFVVKHERKVKNKSIVNNLHFYIFFYFNNS